MGGTSVKGIANYREYLNEEQRSQTGCIAGRMQLDFHHGLLGLGDEVAQTAEVNPATFKTCFRSRQAAG